MHPPPLPDLTRTLASAVMALAVVLLSAGPAAAHAVLLRTEPSPQSTVQAAPADVRLHFSESVEAAFGAVRIFDVDGKRVDHGERTSAGGGRIVVVPARLGEGTYTVTWRVVSTDGHLIRGAFQFYVGAPSTISPVPIEADAGAGTAVGWGFGVVRFAWYSALLAVIGLVVVRRYVWVPAAHAAGLADSDATARVTRRFTRVLPWAWGALLAAWLGRLVFQTASISGLSLRESARPDILGDVLATSFGESWLAGLGFTLLAGLAVAGLTRRGSLFGVRSETWLSVLAGAAAGLALAVANMGHARTEANPTLGVPSVAVHLLAVAVWVGGLAALVVLAAAAWSAVPRPDRNALAGRLVARFSRLALGAVAVLVVTGTVNSILDLATVTDLWRTTYGRVLSAKILLLAVALLFGAWHLRVTPRRLAAADPAGAASRAFRRSSVLELVVLASVVGFASALVALVPGRSLAELARGPVNETKDAGDYTVQLFIDPSSPGPNEIHVTFVDSNGLGAGDVAALSAILTVDGPGGGSTPLPMRLLSPGHFVANRELAAAAYRLEVTGTGPAPPLAAAFSFKLRDPGGDAAPYRLSP
ncbi:MAG TPA: copper resistance protein CopC [Acidimicrobiia bacterium]|nr:copper resistance protein CopC [Acidimicrobiia bacterium]